MNTDGPSFIDEFGKFVLTLPDYEAMVKKTRTIIVMVAHIGNGGASPFA